MESNLEELKEEVLNEAIEDSIEPAKIKLFKVSGFKTYDAIKNEYKYFDGQKEIEKQINEFLTSFDNWYLDSVNIQVVKNFYPHTATGEYEEIWYGTVVYHDPKN
jgi:hypothetical protein